MSSDPQNDLAPHYSAGQHSAPLHNAPHHTGGHHIADPHTADHDGTIRNLRWLLDNLATQAPGVRSVSVVSSDGLPLLDTASADTASGEEDAPEQAAELATVVSGLASLTFGAAEVMDAGGVKQTMVAMDHGCMIVMTVGDGALLGVLTTPDADLSVIGYHMALFVGRAGHVLTPELRGALRRSLTPSAG